MPHKQNGGNHSLLIGFEEAQKQKEQQRQQTKNYWQKYCIIIFIKTEEQQICWNSWEWGRGREENEMCFDRKWKYYVSYCTPLFSLFLL